MDANTINIIFNIIFGCVTIASVIATIIFGIKSQNTANKSTKIAKEVYLTSIRPLFDIIYEERGLPPLHIDSDLYQKGKIEKTQPKWWGSFPYIYLKNNGNGPASDVFAIITHSVRGDIQIPLYNIAQGNEKVILLVPKEQKADVNYQGRYIEKFVKFNWVDKIFATQGKINRIKIIYKDLDGNSYEQE
ncbi:MAG: hypothetical protein FK730_01980 [Asgard group archaeon]|nr:hypothetical protein [Asgard group archaeon]